MGIATAGVKETKAIHLPLEALEPGIAAPDEIRRNHIEKHVGIDQHHQGSSPLVRANNSSVLSRVHTRDWCRRWMASSPGLGDGVAFSISTRPFSSRNCTLVWGRPPPECARQCLA
jgi:hypothetical protein